MAVPEQTTVASEVANGATTVFNHAFKITHSEDLAVTLDGVLQSYLSGYTVAGVGDNSGSITFAVAPANNVIVVRYLAPKLKRVTDYQQFGDWLADVVNLDYDRLWLVLQSLNQDKLRAIKLSIDTSTDQTIAGTAAVRANKLIGFDGSGNVQIKVPAELSLTVVSAFIGTLLDDVDAASARATLGAAALSGAAFTGAVSSTAGDINLKTATTLGNDTVAITALQLIGGWMSITPTVARSKATDTAVAILAVAGFQNSIDKSHFRTSLANLAAFDVTITAGVGVTLEGAASNWIFGIGTAEIIVTKTGANTVSMRRSAVAVSSFAHSYVHVSTANGYGSVNTRIRRFTNVVRSGGSDITYADSATLGGSFIANVEGIYVISYSDNFTSSEQFGLSLNSTQLTTDFPNITSSDILAISVVLTGGHTGHPVYSGFLPAGGVVRAHTRALANSVAITCQLSIARVN